MAMMSPSGGGRSGRGRRRGSRLMSEINVTPVVDVMLVLLVVFMVTAPLLVRGEPVNLAKTASKPLPPSKQLSLSVTVSRSGEIFIGGNKEPVTTDQLGPQLLAIAENGLEDRILVRGDTSADYGDVLNVLSLIRAAGFANVGLVTDKSGKTPNEENP